MIKPSKFNDRKKNTKEDIIIIIIIIIIIYLHLPHKINITDRK